ncbi:hypothetical protein [Oceaniradius stylonematis]|uniref:hypothetical protein n=1 Tax=Oceaniradius stylonematis TaxID=2184161 RepID=UPI003B5CB367
MSDRSEVMLEIVRPIAQLIGFTRRVEGAEHDELALDRRPNRVDATVRGNVAHPALAVDPLSDTDPRLAHVHMDGPLGRVEPFHYVVQVSVDQLVGDAEFGAGRVDRAHDHRSEHFATPLAFRVDRDVDDGAQRVVDGREHLQQVDNRLAHGRRLARQPLPHLIFRLDCHGMPGLPVPASSRSDQLQGVKQ